ncbi:MAG TPA: recombinase family protein [Bryobacteraceae bacterium]|nr:recombinase family protein [Bryobacteraceae bacterium]
MPKTERIREELTGAPAPDYWKKKADAGWRLAAVEWTREAAAERTGSGELAEEIPYGLKIGDDCLHLEANPAEREALLLMLELIVHDRSLSEVAAELNERGFRTRRGAEWGPASVFNMLPRMIQVGPQVFSQDEWAARRRRLFRAV